MGQVFSAVLPAISTSASSAKVIDLAVIPQYESTDNAVMRVTVTSPTTIATVAAASAPLLQVRQIPGGGSATAVVIAQLDRSTQVLTADTPVNLSVASAPQLKVGDVIDVYVVQTGSTGAGFAIGVNVELELN